jgi:CubicO group peptidase (beta-lactamase class C family)
MKTQILIIGFLVQGLMTHHPVLAQSITLTKEGVSEITRFLRHTVEQGTVPGIEAIVVNKNGHLYHETFGKRDLQQNIGLEKGDLFDVASMTKSVTAAGILILVDEGILNLDDPASLYLPDLGGLEVITSFNENDTTFSSVPPKQPMTIRHLLSHTSGMAYPWWDQRLRMILARTEETGFYHYNYPQLPLLFHPGENWGYGIGSRVLGNIIESLSGESLDQFLHHRIFKPLGMDNTFFVFRLILKIIV